MLTRSRILSGLALTAVLFVTAPAIGRMPGHGPHHPGMPPGGPGLIPLPLLLGDPTLTDEQRSQIDDILAEQHQSVGALFRQLDEAHGEFTDALFATGAVTVDDLAPKAQRIAELRGQLMQQEISTAVAIRDVLTPEQIAAAAERKARLDALRPEIMQFYIPE